MSDRSDQDHSEDVEKIESSSGDTGAPDGAAPPEGDDADQAQGAKKRDPVRLVTLAVLFVELPVEVAVAS